MLRSASKYLLPLAVLLAGCSSTSPHTPSIAIPAATSGLHGSVHGGQQPISGATIQLYQVGSTADGSAATSILNAPYNTSGILTGSDGGFDLTGKFNCPTQTTLVYLVATGGNPGLPPPFNNPNSILIAALGQCGNPTNITFINVNEVTTVAAVYALSSFMTSPTAIGSGPSDTQALATAFTLAWEFADVTSGSSPGSNVPVGTTIPTAQINTLANLISACVNSAGGVATDTSTICGKIFSLTTPGATAPTDTTTALLNLAQNPTLNTAALYNLVLPAAPFQPTITEQPPNFAVYPAVPSDFTVSPSSLSFGSVFVGGSTATQAVVISNNTSHEVGLANYTFAGANPSDFALVNSPNGTDCPQPILPGAVCTLYVDFTPTAAGSRTGYLVLKTGTVNPYAAVHLSGIGTVPTAGPVSVSPNSLYYYLYNTPQAVTLTNNGTTPLHISGMVIEIPGSSTVNGYYSQTNDCGSVLAANASCAINVLYNAAALSGSNSGTLVIADDAAAGPQTVTITGETPVVTGPSAIDFGTQSVGTSQTITFVTSWNQPTTGTGFAITGPNASDFVISPTSSCSTVSVQTRCFDNLIFTPSAPGTRTASLQIQNGGTASLTGNGAGPGPYFVVSPAPIVTFSTTPAYTSTFSTTVGTPQTLTYQVQHTGTTFTPVYAPTVSGPHASEFTGTTTCNTASSNTCTVTLTYTPTAAENFTANAVIAESTGVYSQTIPLTVSAASSAAIAISPAGFTFSPTAPGSVSAPQSITVTAVTNNPIRSTIYSGPFLISQGSTCASTPCQVSLEFAPPANATSGNYSGELDLYDPYSNQGRAIYLSGTVYAPTTTMVTPSSLTFNASSTGSQTITVQNTGSNTLVFNAATPYSLGGPDGSYFSVNNSCTSNVAPGGSCSFLVRFNNVSGPRYATLSINSNSTSSPDVVTITSTGP